MSTKRRWTTQWPTDEGWYWFCDLDTSHPVVEPVRAISLGANVVVARGAEELPPAVYRYVWFHPMEIPPSLPEVTQ